MLSNLKKEICKTTYQCYCPHGFFSILESVVTLITVLSVVVRHEAAAVLKSVKGF